MKFQLGPVALELLRKTYDQRCVGTVDHPHGFISTAYVPDGDLPYETAVGEDRYTMPADMDMLIVEAYPSKQEAEIGHRKWVAIMSSWEFLPDELVDCGNGVTQQGVKAELKKGNHESKS